MAGGNDSRFYCSCGLTFSTAERAAMHLDGVAHHEVDPPPVVSFGYLADWLIRYDSIRREHA